MSKKNDNEVRLVNLKQIRTYIENGYQPIRVENGYQNKFVFVYDKKETEDVWFKWIHGDFRP